MSNIKWNDGEPPDTIRGKRLLLIATPTGRPYDGNEDNRPALYIGHYGKANDAFVPARVWGMSANEARPTLLVQHWAEIDLPAGVKVRALKESDIVG